VTLLAAFIFCSYLDILFANFCRFYKRDKDSLFEVMNCDAKVICELLCELKRIVHDL
jgi:hypothetical protein